MANGKWQIRHNWRQFISLFSFSLRSLRCTLQEDIGWCPLTEVGNVATDQEIKPTKQPNNQITKQPNNQITTHSDITGLTSRRLIQFEAHSKRDEVSNRKQNWPKWLPVQLVNGGNISTPPRSAADLDGWCSATSEAAPFNSFHICCVWIY